MKGEHFHWLLMLKHALFSSLYAQILEELEQFTKLGWVWFRDLKHTFLKRKQIRHFLNGEECPSGRETDNTGTLSILKLIKKTFSFSFTMVVHF